MNCHTYAEGIYAEINQRKVEVIKKLLTLLGCCDSMGYRSFDLVFRFGGPPSDAGCKKGDRTTQDKLE